MLDKKQVFMQGDIDETAFISWNSCYEDNTYNIENILSCKNYVDYLIKQKRPNEFVHAIVFTYRRYLELVIKNICRVHMVKDDFNGLVSKYSHDILWCWVEAKGYLYKLSDDDLIFIERVAIDLNNMDPYCFGFRFINDETNVIDTEMKNKSLKINLTNLKHNIDKVDELIAYTYCG